MADPRVTIRNYRMGVGDCHLLSFAGDGWERHILIDCGYFPGSGFPGVDLDAIVADLAEVTHGCLDAIVVTHEHQDHLQGFADQAEALEAMAKGELWLAWTEKPGQKIVPTDRSLAALGAAARGLAESPLPEERQVGLGIEDALGFAQGTANTFDLVKGWFTDQRKRYGSPGDVLEPEWLPGVRIYVLGPPKDLAMLHKTTGTKDSQMYELAADGMGFAAAALDEAEPGTLSPFDAGYARPRLPKLLAEFYAEPWRRVDTDWLMGASRFALQMDTYTNNTSLVLAFELVESGQVLLFVGDAQIGSWLSWQSVEFKDARGRKLDVTTDDLLARTVYYKVGHHGSHNATLVEHGLEAMTSESLRASIPTHEAWAKAVKHWTMPNANLYAALQQRCAEPVLRTDEPAAATDLCIQCSL